MGTEGIQDKYVNPYTDFGFKLLFGTAMNKEWQQIASALDIIIHLGRMRDKSRKVLEITEVCDCEKQKIRLRPIFVYHYGSEKLEKERELENVAKLQAAGLSLV